VFRCPALGGGYIFEEIPHTAARKKKTSSAPSARLSYISSRKGAKDAEGKKKGVQHFMLFNGFSLDLPFL